MFGSRLSAPVSRATRTPRVASTCQSSSSQRSCARRHASHSQRRSSPPPSGSPNARSACESGATDGAYPSVNRVTRASRSASAAPGGVHPARRARGLGDLALVRAGAEAPGEHRRRDRLEVGLAGHLGVQGIEPPGRLEQQRRRVAPAPAGEHDLRAQPLQPRALELVDRPELGGGQEVGRGRGVGDVELRLGRGERALDAHGRVWRQLGRPLQERGGRGQPAAPLRAVGRARHLRGHRLVRRRRRMRAMPGATVGIEDRVGRVGERPVHVAAVARVRRAVDRRADERMREAHASRRARSTRRPRPAARPRRRSRDARRRATAGSGRPAARPPPSGAAAACRAEAPGRAGGRCARCGSPAGARRGARTRPRAPRASIRAAARSARAGCRAPRRGSAPAHARRAARGSSRPGAAGPRRRPALRSRAPAAPRARARRRTRAAANTSPTRSARSRRATNASVCADTRSSHCASSTMHTSGCSSAASASRLRTANPTRKRSGGGPALRPNAVLSASRCGLGRFRRRPSIGAHSACRPANASSISDSMPAARAIRHPSAASVRCRSSAVLPTPASPRRTSTRLWPARTPATSRSSTSRSLTRSTNPDDDRWASSMPALIITGRARTVFTKRARAAFQGGVGSPHDLLTDHRSPEPVRPAAVAAPPRRPAGASERLGRGDGEGRGRGRVPGGRDHQRRGGRDARLSRTTKVRRPTRCSPPPRGSQEASRCP